MLSYIKWEIKYIDSNSVILLTESGVWYEIIINELIYSNIYNKSKIELFLFHNITENSQNIFWFLEIDDRKFFKELIKISWIWGKVAILILSIWKNKLVDAILNDDLKTLQSIKWVGKKMAEKIILEFKDKDFIITNKYNIQNNIEKNALQNETKKQIIFTLNNMWYNSKQVEEILNNLPIWIDNIDDIIPYIIKNI